MVTLPSMPLRDDYLMRLIEQFAQFIARIAGFNAQRAYDSALREARRAWDALDIPHELVDRMDGAELAKLLREPAKIRAAAALLTEEAEALAATGDPVHATLRRKRAFQLYGEAHRLDPQDGDDDAMTRIAVRLPPGELGTL